MNSSRSISHSLQQDAPKLPTGFGFAGEPINVAVVIGTMFVLLAALSLTGAIPTMVSAVLIMVSALMIRWNCGQGIGRTASVFGAASVLSTALIHQVSLLDAVSICAVLLASAEWIGALRRSFEDEKRAADFDGLTGALRPHAIRCILDYELNRIKQSGGRMALFFMDLDNFKEVNDCDGHAAGDDVLKNFTARIRAALKPDDVIARLGGDEFLILITNVRNEHEVWQTENRLESALSQTRHGLTASVGGLVVGRTSSTDLTCLLAEADRLMYEVKRSGKARIRISGITAPPLESVAQPSRAIAG